jgi:transcriptional regulator with XRE-family HTH domain
MEEFKDRLIYAMKERGFRAADLSKRTGLSKARISQYVNGKFVPKSDAIILMAETLRVSELWLMGKSDEMDAQPARVKIPCPENIAPLSLCRYPILGRSPAACPSWPRRIWTAATSPPPRPRQTSASPPRATA